MIVELDLENDTCKVIKEAGDPVFRRSGWALAESTFLYHVKIALMRQGYDVIKKRIWKDGNIVDETQQWIRTRKFGTYTAPNEFAIFNLAYALCDLGEEFNKLQVGEHVFLSVIH
jgi:hypothetical protein